MKRKSAKQRVFEAAMKWERAERLYGSSDLYTVKMVFYLQKACDAAKKEKP